MQPRDLERIHAKARVFAVLSLQHSDCHAYWDIDIAVQVAVAVPTLELICQRVGDGKHSEGATFNAKHPSLYFLSRPLNGLSPAGFITMHCAENNQFRIGSQANELTDG